MLYSNRHAAECKNKKILGVYKKNEGIKMSSSSSRIIIFSFLLFGWYIAYQIAELAL